MVDGFRPDQLAIGEPKGRCSTTVKCLIAFPKYLAKVSGGRKRLDWSTSGGKYRHGILPNLLVQAQVTTFLLDRFKD